MIKKILKNIRPQKIELGYKPQINVEMIQEILRTHIPEYNQTLQKTWKANQSIVTLKKSFFVHALVLVAQDYKKQKTIISIDGGMEAVAVVLFGFILHYVLRGSFIDDVKEILERELL